MKRRPVCAWPSPGGTCRRRIAPRCSEPSIGSARACLASAGAERRQAASAWLHEILSPHVDELVVVGSRRVGARSEPPWPSACKGSSHAEPAIEVGDGSGHRVSRSQPFRRGALSLPGAEAKPAQPEAAARANPMIHSGASATRAFQRGSQRSSTRPRHRIVVADAVAEVLAHGRHLAAPGLQQRIQLADGNPGLAMR
jgi:hypothetical protein